MNVKPIQVLKDGVLIPLEHLPEADEFEIEQINGYVMVRPKLNQAVSEKPEKSWLHDLIGVAETDRDVADSENDLPARPRFSWVGSAKSDNPKGSVEVEDILEAEIDRRSGWTLKK